MKIILKEKEKPKKKKMRAKEEDEEECEERRVFFSVLRGDFCFAEFGRPDLVARDFGVVI